MVRINILGINVLGINAMKIYIKEMDNMCLEWNKLRM